MRSESCGTEIRNKIWPCDFAGNPSAGTGKAQVSHLLPAAKGHHKEWLDIAAAVLGLPENSPLDAKLKGLRGSKTGSQSHDKYTGVVHFTTNKVLMKKQLWDGPNPVFLLIPCLSMEQAKAWNGGEYAAVAIAGLHLREENAKTISDVSEEMQHQYLTYRKKMQHQYPYGKKMQHKDLTYLIFTVTLAWLRYDCTSRIVLLHQNKLLLRSSSSGTL